MNKVVYSGLSILELSKILIFAFWYDYPKKLKFEKKQICIIWIQAVSLHT